MCREIELQKLVFSPNRMSALLPRIRLSTHGNRVTRITGQRGSRNHVRYSSAIFRDGRFRLAGG